MILTLFLSFIFISLVMITIGLAKPSESAQALIGFFFLFLLSFTIMDGSVEYQTGENNTMAYSYIGGNVSSTNEIKLYTYDNFDNTLSSRIGIYLAIASAVGFAGVLYSLKKTKKENEEDE